MSKMKTGYIVMCYPKHSDLEVEYTGGGRFLGGDTPLSG